MVVEEVETLLAPGFLKRGFATIDSFLFRPQQPKEIFPIMPDDILHFSSLDRPNRELLFVSLNTRTREELEE